MQAKEMKVIRLDSARIRTSGIAGAVDSELIEAGVFSRITCASESAARLNETKLAAATVVLEIDPLPAFLGDTDFISLMKYCADFGFRLRIGDNAMQQLAISYLTGKLHTLHGMDWSPAKDLANRTAALVFDPIPETI
jgi:hypothetical protein